MTKMIAASGKREREREEVEGEEKKCAYPVCA